MIQPVKHLAVNWVDGMKILEKHFTEHDNFIIDSIRDSNSLWINSFNYGLLPQSSRNEENNALFDIYNTATDDVQLIIRNCSAITAAGFRVEVRDYKTNVKSLLKSKTSISKEDYYILISVNPYEKVPYGDIDPDEKPPRHPYCVPQYHIDLMQTLMFNESQTNGNCLIIGKVTFDGDIVRADEDFIPPCVNIYSLPKLMYYYDDFAKMMGNIQKYAINIIQKSAKSGQNSVLANKSIAAAELEEMLNYTYEWSDIAPHNLLNQLSVVAEINYNHNSCGSYMANIELLLKYLDVTFKKLSELDYIGQRKENIIVNEQEISVKTEIQRGWNVLD